jgi:uncharacterized membrane protein YccC
LALPTWRDWLFSIKTFAGAMLALWAALYLDLDRPYWAMATAYIVAQPSAGALRSKAAYRFGGTFIGAVATIIFVPNLVNAPELLVAALALWVAGCIYLALLDRTPRSYLFLLSGYTVALIGLPAVDTPGLIWDVVLARVEEISLGILCTTAVGTLILPVPLGPALAQRIDVLLREAAQASQALLSGLPDNPAARAARRRLAAETVEIGGLAAFLAYDVSAQAAAAPSVILLRERLILLQAVLSGIADRIGALRDTGGLRSELRSLLDRVSAWLTTRDALVASAPALHEAIAALEPPEDDAMDWNDVILSGLLMRLHELTDLCHDIASLRHQLDTGNPALPALALPAATRPARHQDHAMAAYSGAAAALTIGLVSAFWIATAWPEGSLAASLAAVASSFFASQDDPVPNLVKFTYGVVIAVIVAAIYLFAILPRAHDFEMLVLALSPFYLLLGVLIAQPRLAPAAGPVAFISATLMALSASYAADFATFANGALASVGGLVGAAIVLRVVRSVGANWAAQRLLRANRRDIARAAARAGGADRRAFAALMLDRLGEAIPRIAASAEGAEAAAGKALAEIRVGINVVDVQSAAAVAPPAQQAALRDVLAGVAARFGGAGGEDARLLAAIDGAITASCAVPPKQRRQALLALGGLRRALFRDAPPYAPRPVPPPALERAA